MIPVWILTALHYVSLTAALAVTALIGWHYLRPEPEPKPGSGTETEGTCDESAENG